MNSICIHDTKQYMYTIYTYIYMTIELSLRLLDLSLLVHVRRTLLQTLGIR